VERGIAFPSRWTIVMVGRQLVSYQIPASDDLFLPKRYLFTHLENASASLAEFSSGCLFSSCSIIWLMAQNGIASLGYR